MSLQLADNLDYRGQKPNFTRDTFKTFKEMSEYPECDLDDGHISLCLEDGKRYKFSSSLNSDPTTGKWRKVIDTALNADSENPLQNKVIAENFTKQDESIKNLQNNKVDKTFKLNGHTLDKGSLNLTKDDIGLGNVRNVEYEEIIKQYSDFLAEVLGAIKLEEFVSTGEIDSSAISDMNNITVLCYSTTKKGIFAKDKTGKLHYSFPTSTKFGRLSGDKIVPFSNKLYLCEGNIYKWNGTDLIQYYLTDEEEKTLVDAIIAKGSVLSSIDSIVYGEGGVTVNYTSIKKDGNSENKNFNIGLATNTKAGLMSPSEKTRLSKAIINNAPTLNYSNGKPAIEIGSDIKIKNTSGDTLISIDGEAHYKGILESYGLSSYIKSGDDYVEGHYVHLENTDLSGYLKIHPTNSEDGFYVNLEETSINFYKWKNSNAEPIGKIDNQGNLTFNSFKKEGGTSDQLLTADGGVTSLSSLGSSEGNHYTPIEDSGSKLTAATNNDAINLVKTSVDVVSALKRDPKGHVVGIESKKLEAKIGWDDIKDKPEGIITGDELAGYLPLTGGTISNDDPTISTPLVINSNSDYGPGIMFYHKKSFSGRIDLLPESIKFLTYDSSNKVIGLDITKDDVIYKVDRSEYKIWHEGNFNPGHYVLVQGGTLINPTLNGKITLSEGSTIEGGTIDSTFKGYLSDGNTTVSIADVINNQENLGGSIGDLGNTMSKVISVSGTSPNENYRFHYPKTENDTNTKVAIQTYQSTVTDQLVIKNKSNTNKISIDKSGNLNLNDPIISAGGKFKSSSNELSFTDIISWYNASNRIIGESTNISSYFKYPGKDKYAIVATDETGKNQLEINDLNQVGKAKIDEDGNFFLCPKTRVSTVSGEYEPVEFAVGYYHNCGPSYEGDTNNHYGISLCSGSNYNILEISGNANRRAERGLSIKFNDTTSKKSTYLSYNITDGNTIFSTGLDILNLENAEVKAGKYTLVSSDDRSVSFEMTDENTLTANPYYFNIPDTRLTTRRITLKGSDALGSGAMIRFTGSDEKNITTLNYSYNNENKRSTITASNLHYLTMPDARLTATRYTVNGGTSGQFMKADGSLDSTSYFPTAGGTVTGNITATKFIKSGGSSNQFLKADGSVDGTVYLNEKSWRNFECLIFFITGTGSSPNSYRYGVLPINVYINTYNTGFGYDSITNTFVRLLGIIIESGGQTLVVGLNEYTANLTSNPLNQFFPTRAEALNHWNTKTTVTVQSQLSGIYIPDIIYKDKDNINIGIKGTDWLIPSVSQMQFISSKYDTINFAIRELNKLSSVGADELVQGRQYGTITYAANGSMWPYNMRNFPFSQGHATANGNISYSIRPVYLY